MFKTIKMWWKIRKLNRALLKQAKTEAHQEEVYTAERVKHWVENNEFGLTKEDLQAACMSSIPKAHQHHVDKEIN